MRQFKDPRIFTGIAFGEPISLVTCFLRTKGHHFSYTPEECADMVQLGYKYEYKRSEDVGERRFDGTHGSVQSTRRTSENAWCSTLKGCRAEDLAVRLRV